MSAEQTDLFGFTASNEAITAATNLEADKKEEKPKQDNAPCREQISFI